MRNCYNCGALLFENARFCHECGSKTLVEEISCAHCQSINSMDASFCKNCGQPLFSTSHSSTSKNSHTAKQPQAESPELWPLKQAFFDSLKLRIEQEHRPEQYTSYVEEIQKSGFQDTLEHTMHRLFQEMNQMRKQGIATVQVDAHQQMTFEELLDYFIIHHCKHLNDIPLPEKILKYQGQRGTEINLFHLILDYLDFEQEPERVYIDFISMPLKKLQQAQKAFLQPHPNEKIFFICDQSITGSCKEGFAMTENALYWKAHLQKPHKLQFQEIMQIEREQEWLLINGYFFNVSPSMNLKMLKLLKRIRRLF